MTRLHRLLSGLRALLTRRRANADLDDELQGYLEAATRAGLARGLSPDAAAREARVSLGSVAAIKDHVGDAGWESIVAAVWQDARIGLRLLRRAPAFAAVAIATLAVGIGANTLLFSIVNGVLLRPLPYPAPHELVALSESKPNFATGSISYPNFLDWQRDNRTFAAMAIARASSASLTGAGDAEHVSVQLVSSDFFRLLDVTPVAGRTFAPGEADRGGAATALISEALWRRKFGGAPAALGQSIALDGQSFAIVGVVPASFDLRVWTFEPADVYCPIGQWTNPSRDSRAAGLGIHGVGRLKPGVTLEAARTDMDGVTRQLAAAFPKEDTGVGATLAPLDTWIRGRISTDLWMLQGAVGFVLLIVCVNVGNLMLARATARAREFAVRASLGASRARLVRQLITESLVLSAFGGGLGLFLAWLGTGAAIAALPATLPRTSSIALDGRVLTFTALVSIAAGLLFGLVPALRSMRARTIHALRSRSVVGRSPAQRVLIVVEVAMAFVLVVGAGLMLRTLGALWRVDPGFDMSNVLTYNVSLSPSMKTDGPVAVRAALREASAAIARVPGVEGTTLSWGALPMAGDDEDLFWFANEPTPATQHDMKWTISYVVDEQYLRVMGVPLRRGRFFTAQDDEHAPFVVVVDEVFAAQYCGGKDPIGQRVMLEYKGGPATIVGVVNHVKQWGLDTDDTQDLRAQLYFPLMQLRDDATMLSWTGITGLSRLDAARPPTAETIRAGLRQADASDDLFGAATLTSIVADTLVTRRFAMTLLAIFAGVAVLLASLGIYGVIAYGVAERTSEIGLRMALGAGPMRVLGGVLGDGLRMTGMGIAAGLLLAMTLTRVMRTLLFQVSATDPLTFAAVTALLAIVAAAASLIPARRAMRIDPAEALK